MPEPTILTSGYKRIWVLLGGFRVLLRKVETDHIVNGLAGSKFNTMNTVNMERSGVVSKMQAGKMWENKVLHLFNLLWILDLLQQVFWTEYLYIKQTKQTRNFSLRSDEWYWLDRLSFNNLCKILIFSCSYALRTTKQEMYKHVIYINISNKTWYQYSHHYVLIIMLTIDRVYWQFGRGHSSQKYV